jgi:hypothetical protein
MRFEWEVSSFEENGLDPAPLNEHLSTHNSDEQFINAPQISCQNSRVSVLQAMIVPVRCSGQQ